MSNIQDIQNKYPSVDSYKTTTDTIVTLFGKFPVNSIDIETFSLDNINVIDDTSFESVISVVEGESFKLFTSFPFFKKLEESKNSNNPYLVAEVLQPENILTINLDSIKELHSTLKNLEEELSDTTDYFAVNVRQHIFINSIGEIDYVELIRYIDWVLSNSGLSGNTSITLIPSPSLVVYDIEDKLANVIETTVDDTPRSSIINDNPPDDTTISAPPLPPDNLIPTDTGTRFPDDTDESIDTSIPLSDVSIQRT
jgi:hypothetical protein